MYKNKAEIWIFRIFSPLSIFIYALIISRLCSSTNFSLFLSLILSLIVVGSSCRPYCCSFCRLLLLALHVAICIAHFDALLFLFLVLSRILSIILLLLLSDAEKALQEWLLKSGTKVAKQCDLVEWHRNMQHHCYIFIVYFVSLSGHLCGCLP